MNLTELSNLADTDIVIRRYANQKPIRWSAELEYAETKIYKEHCILQATYGEGKTPSRALFDYVSKLRGRFLVVRAGSVNRFEFPIPDDLEV